MVKKRFGLLDVTVYFIVGLFTLVSVFPFINLLAVSMSDYSAFLQHPMMIFPRKLYFKAYELVFTHPLIITTYKNTILTTVSGTAFSMFLTITMAFPLSRKHFRAKPVFIYMMVFTMLFNGGLIPNFYLVRSLGLLDSLWALIIPGSLSTFNVILMINFFKSIPDSLEEAAKIDGASDLYVLMRIILPLSLPIIATLSLFYAVGRWNSFFNAIIYIRDRNKWTLQLLLREVVLTANYILQESGGDPNATIAIPLLNVRYATIVAAIFPILCVYPFIQKYFIKGVMIGAVKG